MLKIFSVLLIMLLLVSGCGSEKIAEPPKQIENPAPKVETVAEQPPVPALTGYEVLTMANHPKLNDPVVCVREFYRNVPALMVAIVNRDKDAPQAILTFQKNNALQEDFGEVDKIVANVSATGAAVTFEEIKPIIRSYFPVELVQENFIYDRGARLFDDNGNVIYAWKYKSNGNNFYHGKSPFDGNLTVAVFEQNGAVSAFTMFLGKEQKVPFIRDLTGYQAEEYDVDF